MGISSDGILAYGYNLGSQEDVLEQLGLEDEESDDIENDFDAYLEDKLLASVGFTEEYSKDNVGFFDRKKEAESKLGVELMIHCSYDYPMWMIIPKGSDIIAYRGRPVEIGPLAIDPEWNERLNKALVILDIIPVSGPSWHLTSLYG